METHRLDREIDMGTLNGKIAWVTGAGGGIGEASAKALAQAGAHVVVSGRRSAELDRVVALITTAGGKADAAQLDVVDAQATQTIADDVIQRLGGIDIFMPNMREKGDGTLILTSSWAGRHPSRLTGPAYSASKHAVVALSHSINQDEGVNGIRCTVLMPGEVATPIMQSRPKPPSAEDIAKMLQADDLGAMVRYIAEAPPHVCINEVLISPTWNRSFVGVAEMGGMKL